MLGCHEEGILCALPNLGRPEQVEDLLISKFVSVIPTAI